MREYNFDGLVGPTHNYGGLSAGNVASMRHGGELSNPRAAALQGLEKMRLAHDLGAGQAVLPPQPRPSLGTLRRLGFAGSDEEVLARAARDAEPLLRQCSSASAMWAANAATVAPSCDAADGRLHLTPANLVSMFHRSIEADTTTAVLRAIFADERRFVVHAPLPPARPYADEGAANHTRLATRAGAVHLLAWGRRGFGEADGAGPRRYPARQTLEASEAIARLHRLDAARVVFPRQHPDGIDAGAFHTDVLAVGHGRFLMLHELAFSDGEAVIARLRALLGAELSVVVATEAELPAAEAVGAYPFNSQLLEVAAGGLVLLAPEECRESPRARAFLERVAAEDNPVERLEYRDVRQSMNNGGGPACLRLRVPMSELEAGAIQPGVLFSPELHARLATWIGRHYRDRLAPDDLADPTLAREGLTALDELTGILGLGPVYDFQRAPELTRAPLERR
jgi:succinylarginine dihydrolase